MSRSSGVGSKGEHNRRGKAFEDTVGAKLAELFSQVKRGVRIEGFSGIIWKVDFLVDSNLIVEATVQRRLETKINSTFLRLADITRKHPGMKGALVVEEVHVLFHHTLGRKYFPTSEYKTFLAFGYPILAFKDLGRILALRDVQAGAFGISTLPQGFNPRSVLHDRKLAANKIVQALKDGPMRMRDLCSKTGFSRHFVTTTARQHPEIKRVRTYCGLEEDEIYRAMLARRVGGPVQTALLRKWLEGKFVRALEENGSYRTVDLARDLGLNPDSLAHFIHRMRVKGMIHKVGKGRWALSSDSNQTHIA